MEESILAEWRIRRLKKPSVIEKEDVIKWALYSIGVEGKSQDVYLYLLNKGSSTVGELARIFGLGEEEVRGIIDTLYTYGLVDRIGSEVIVGDDLASSISKRYIPRLEDTLNRILEVLGGVSPGIARTVKLRVQAKFGFAGELDFMLASIDKLSESVKALRVRISELYGRYNQEIIDNISDELGDIEDEISSIREDIEDKVSDLEDFRGDMESELEKIRERMNYVSEKLQELDRRIESLTK